MTDSTFSPVFKDMPFRLVINCGNGGNAFQKIQIQMRPL